MDIGIIEYYAQESKEYAEKVIILTDRTSLRKKGVYEKDIASIRKALLTAHSRIDLLIKKIRREDDNSNKKTKKGTGTINTPAERSL